MTALIRDAGRKLDCADQMARCTDQMTPPRVFKFLINSYDHGLQGPAEAGERTERVLGGQLAIAS